MLRIYNPDILSARQTCAITTTLFKIMRVLLCEAWARYTLLCLYDSKGENSRRWVGKQSSVRFLVAMVVSNTAFPGFGCSQLLQFNQNRDSSETIFDHTEIDHDLSARPSLFHVRVHRI